MTLNISSEEYLEGKSVVQNLRFLLFSKKNFSKAPPQKIILKSTETMLNKAYHINETANFL